MDSNLELQKTRRPFFNPEFFAVIGVVIFASILAMLSAGWFWLKTDTGDQFLEHLCTWTLADYGVEFMVPFCSKYQIVDLKPVIYLYPEKETDVNVKLDYYGKLTTTYPAYKSSWKVKAFPDGHLVNSTDNKEYSYLFWEGVDKDATYDLSKGFVIKGSDTAGFLQDKLSKLGLTPKEYNEFIVYWLPKMQDNEYNLIHFASKEEYDDRARLNISPEPDSMLRVFMVYKALDNEVDVAPQQLETFERKGFSVVEWGGSEVK